MARELPCDVWPGVLHVPAMHLVRDEGVMVASVMAPLVTISYYRLTLVCDGALDKLGILALHVSCMKGDLPGPKRPCQTWRQQCSCQVGEGGSVILPGSSGPILGRVFDPKICLP